MVPAAYVLARSDDLRLTPELGEYVRRVDESLGVGPGHRSADLAALFSLP